MEHYRCRGELPPRSASGAIAKARLPSRPCALAIALFLLLPGAVAATARVHGARWVIAVGHWLAPEGILDAMSQPRCHNYGTPTTHGERDLCSWWQLGLVSLTSSRARAFLWRCCVSADVWHCSVQAGKESRRDHRNGVVSRNSVECGHYSCGYFERPSVCPNQQIPDNCNGQCRMACGSRLR